MTPKRKKREPMGLRESSEVRCQSHLKWVRGCECTLTSKEYWCKGRVEAHHVQSFHATEGGMGMKVGDDRVVPLCIVHHASVHNIGQTAFEASHKIDLEGRSKLYWAQSPHGQKYRREHP